MLNPFSVKAKHEIQSNWVHIDVDGQPMQTYVSQPQDEGAWPAVLVLMEIFGVNSHIQNVAERVAAAGYVAIAPNYYHRTTENLNLGYTDRDVVIGRKHKEQTTLEGVLADLKAVIDYAGKHPAVRSNHKMGCIGFCYGGHVAYIAAGLPQVAATASFYGGGIATTSPGNGKPTIERTNLIHGEILCLFGMEDSLIPQRDVNAIEEALHNAHIRAEVIRYANTGHGFFCDQRGSYDPSAAEDAWSRVLDLFARNLS